MNLREGLDMAQVDCARCGGTACTTEDLEATPELCPRRVTAEAMQQAEQIRTSDSEVQRYAQVAAEVEETGYRKWPRVQELIEFCKRLDIQRIGIAFCVGLREETRALVEILESHGFTVDSVACTVNGGCNPVGQALTLNELHTQLNVIMGLCLGHDILFQQFSEAPVTTLVVKDRVTCHNPVGPIVNRCWHNSLMAPS